MESKRTDELRRFAFGCSSRTVETVGAISRRSTKSCRGAVLPSKTWPTLSLGCQHCLVRECSIGTWSRCGRHSRTEITCRAWARSVCTRTSRTVVARSAYGVWVRETSDAACQPCGARGAFLDGSQTGRVGERACRAGARFRCTPWAIMSMRADVGVAALPWHR